MGETAITLPEVIERVLANDPDLQISRIQLRGGRIRHPQRRRASTIPWPALQAYRTRSVTPVASILGGTRRWQTHAGDLERHAAGERPFPVGRQLYSLNFANSERAAPTTSSSR